MSRASLITLTSLIDHKFLAETPEFPRDVWPLILAHESSIQLHIVVDRIKDRFDLRKLDVPLRDPRGSVYVHPLPRLSALTEEQLEVVQYLSSSNGHLAILYVASCGAPVTRALVNLWPTATFQPSYDWEALEIERKRKSTFIHFVESRIESSCVLAFAHEADPLYVFGVEERLRILFDQREPPVVVF